MQVCFCVHVGCEFFTTLKDFLHHSDRERVMLMSWGAPSDACFQTILSKHRDVEDVLLHFCKETHVVLVRAYPQLSSDVFKEMNMADLHDAARKHVLCRHSDCIVLITRDAPEWIASILEFCEELNESLKIFRGSEQASRDVMCEVIHPIDERNLLFVALYSDILPINDQRAAEAFGIAVPFGDIVVVRDFP